MNELDPVTQKYDAWLHWNIASACNLKCVYCYRNIRVRNNEPVSVAEVHTPLWRKLVSTPKIGARALMQKFRISIYEKYGRVAPINIPALMRSLEKTEKTFRIGFAGSGEPFLTPNLVEVCAELTKKHFVSLITNLITCRTAEFAERINPRRVVRIVASLHIKELERLNLTDKYLDVYHLYRSKGFRIAAKEVAYPALRDEARKYLRYFNERGVALCFVPFRGYYNEKLYPESYTSEEFQLFGLTKPYGEIFGTKGKTCNAGYSAGVVSRAGDISPCYQMDGEMGNIYGSIRFRDKLTVCPFSFCSMPVLRSPDVPLGIPGDI